jgi:hypothetical protein
MTSHKKLIKAALPLDEINTASAWGPIREGGDAD